MSAFRDFLLKFLIRIKILMVWIVGSALLHSGLYGQLLITIWNIHLFYGSFIDGHYCYEVKISSENTKIIYLWSGLTCPPLSATQM